MTINKESYSDEANVWLYFSKQTEKLVPIRLDSNDNDSNI